MERYYMIMRTPDNKLKKYPDLGGRKHKSFRVLYIKKAPHFKEKTAQQTRIGNVGETCGPILQGMELDFNSRRFAMGTCAALAYDGVTGDELVRAVKYAAEKKVMIKSKEAWENLKASKLA